MSDVDKKSNKQKKKKKPSAAPNGAAPTPAAPTELDKALELNPNASVDGQWEAVVDIRKKKAEERRKKKLAGGEDGKGEAIPADEKTAQENKDVNDYEPKSAKKAKNKTGNNNGGKQQQQQQASKKKKVEPPAVKRPNSEAELVAVITKILDDTPQRFLQVAAIGDRLQSLTKVAWNKTYKPQFGSLKDFLTNKSDNFAVDQKFERVYLRKDYVQVAEEKAKVAEKQAEKKAKKEQKKAAAAVPAAAASHAAVEDSSSVGRVVLVGLLATSLLAFSFYSVGTLLK